MAQHSGHPRDHTRKNNYDSHHHRHGRDNGRRFQPTGLLPLDPFTIFGALYLGLTGGDYYQPLQLPDLARRFGVSVGELKNKIHEFGLDRETVRHSGFDLEMAQLDIRVAPEGISRRELAKTWFVELQKVLPARPATEAATPAPPPPVSAAAPRDEEPASAKSVAEEPLGQLFDEDFLDP
jgi:hypothetical protein